LAETVRVRAGSVEFVVVKGLLYTETDEWARVEDGVAIVGITDYAQRKLKDIVGVDLPEPGVRVKAGDSVAVVESVKHAADVYSPLSGEIVEVNERLYDEPELINKDPYGEGWMFKIKISDPSETGRLLSWEEYVELVKKREEGHG